MLQIDRRIHGKIEHIVIEIAALDAIFPCPAENGMCLSGKERGLIIQANLIRAGQQPISMLKAGKGWRISVDFKLDLDQLVRRDGSCKPIIRIEQKDVLLRVFFQEGACRISFLIQDRSSL